MVGGGDDARVAYQSGGDGFGMPAVKRDLRARVSRHLHLEALTLRAEAPARIEVFLAHKPVNAHGDNRLARYRALPGKALGGDPARLDHANG